MEHVSELENSILLSVKDSIGPAIDYDVFNTQLIEIINSILNVLTQIGVGPTSGFAITGTEEKWEDFLGDRETLLSMCKSYVSIRTRLIFDPPTSSFVIDSLKKNADELEWRIYIMVQEMDRYSDGVHI